MLDKIEEAIKSGQTGGTIEKWFTIQWSQEKSSSQTVVHKTLCK